MTKSADLLLANALVLTMDQEMHQYEPCAVAVSGDSILAAGPEAEIRNEYDAKQTVDCGGKVLMPGLIDAHTHVPMTLMRGLADDLRAFLAGEPITARPLSRMEHAFRACRKRPVLLVSAVLLLAFGGVAAWALGIRSRGSTKPCMTPFMPSVRGLICGSTIASVSRPTGVLTFAR
jgi:hypothetical protein